MVNLMKEREEKVKVCLKKFSPNKEVVAKVNFILDISGSMLDLFHDGNRNKNSSMQETVERIFVIAKIVDDDKSLGMGVFDEGFRWLKDIVMENYKGYVQKSIVDKNLVGGGTNYGPFIKAVLRQYDKSNNKSIPVFNIVITDGVNWDQHEAESLLKNSVDKNIFWMFIGIGCSSFRFLETLKSRNVGFVKVTDLSKVDDDELYNMLFKDFIEFLNVNSIEDDKGNINVNRVIGFSTKEHVFSTQEPEQEDGSLIKYLVPIGLLVFIIVLIMRGCGS